MCIYFECKRCAKQNIIYCQSVDIYKAVDPGCTLPTIDPLPHQTRKTCETCKLIIGTKAVLGNLVYQNPWLSDEGMAGVEMRQEWEIGPGLLKKEHKSIWSRGHVDQGWKIIENLQNMGLGNLAGREALNEGEGFEDNKSSGLDAIGGTVTAWGSETDTVIEEQDADKKKEEKASECDDDDNDEDKDDNVIVDMSVRIDGN
jgi:hypothetical protein